MEKNALEEIQALVDKYASVYQGGFSHESAKAFKNLVEGFNKAAAEDSIPLDVKQEMAEVLRDMRARIMNQYAQEDGIADLKRIIDSQLDGKQIETVSKQADNKEVNQDHINDLKKRFNFNLGEQKRDMTAQDIVQSPTDDKRKLEEELQQQDKVADRQNVQDNSDDAGRARIQKMKEKHGIKFNDNGAFVYPRDIADIMRSELGDSDVEKNFYEDVRGFIRDYNHEDIGDFRGVQTQASKNNEAQEKNVREQVLKKEEQKTEDRIKREDNVSFWDGVQAILSKHENKKENSQKTEDKNSDKVANKQDVKPRPLSHAELEDRGLARVEAFKEKYDLSIPGRKRYNQAQWEQILDQELGGTDIEDTYRNDFIRGMMESYWKDPEIRKGPGSEIPKPTIKEQIKREFEQKQNKVADNKDTKRLVPEPQKQQDVKPQFGNFNMGKPAEKDVNKQEQSPQQKPVTQKQTEQQRDMTAKDIVQSPADNKREFEEELREAQQIGMISKPVAKLYKGVYNAVEKVVNFDERLGQAVDKEHNKKVENSVEISKEKTNKFKDGIINVLNKRDAERAAHEQEKKENKEKQERLFIKKMFGKGIIND